jgi:hypothetical protein
VFCICFDLGPPELSHSVTVVAAFFSMFCARYETRDTMDWFGATAIGTNVWNGRLYAVLETQIIILAMHSKSWALSIKLHRISFQSWDARFIHPLTTHEEPFFFPNISSTSQSFNAVLITQSVDLRKVYADTNKIKSGERSMRR